MDPVYAGSIAGLSVFFLVVLGAIVTYAYIEYRSTGREDDYDLVES